MFCNQCGERIADGARFCGQCGAVVPPASPAGEAAPSSASASAASAPPDASSPLPGAGAVPAFDAGAVARGLVARVKAILLTPKTEWAVIAAESSSSTTIYVNYVVPLVAIGIVAGFIGHSLIGIGVPVFGTFRVPIGSGLATAVVSFAFALVGVYLVSWLVNALAPTFDGRKDTLAALKVVAYAYTPAWVAAVANVIPALSILGFLAGLYGLYLLYLGLPVLMRCPQEKAIGYTVVLVLCAIVVSVVIGVVSTFIVGGLGFAGLTAGGALSRPGVADDKAAADAAAGVLSGIFGGKSEAERAKVGDALRTLEKLGAQADKPAGGGEDQGQSADVHAALGAVGTIIAGGKDVQPVDFRKLRELMPESLPGMARIETTGQKGEAMGLKGSSATARYSGDGAGNLTIEIADMGSLSGLAGLAAQFDPNVEKETDTGYERTRRVNGQLVHERYDRRGRSGEVMVLAGNRFAVTVRGTEVEAETLTATLQRIDTSKLAALAAAAP